LDRLITYLYLKLNLIHSFSDCEITMLINDKQKNMRTIKNLQLLLFFFIFTGCTEPYILETNTYEEALIVQATITNEYKRQEITLTKSSQFEATETQIESDAAVYITDNSGNRYDFKEESGIYKSTTEFQAVPDREYRLTIITKDGRSFESTTEKLTTVNPMQDVTATVKTNETGSGVAINISSFDPTRQSNYYRYEYEETYKIITPKWSPQTAVVTYGAISEIPKIEIVPNATDTKVCYGYYKNTDIILVNTNEFKEDRIDYQLRFLSDQNYIISHRYSILVKQYIESLASYTYYKTLKKISGSGSLLSPLQPGIINGNIKSKNNIDDTVVGYFDVASVSTKRIYFNYADLFPGGILPPYYTECYQQDLIWCFLGDNCDGDYLAYGFYTNAISYYKNMGSLYTVFPAPCGDCTSFSSNIKPPFWED
jgi:hypothetical protein